MLTETSHGSGNKREKLYLAEVRVMGVLDDSTSSAQSKHILYEQFNSSITGSFNKNAT